MMCPVYERDKFTKDNENINTYYCYNLHTLVSAGGKFVYPMRVVVLLFTSKFI